jgi:altronate dehydratase
LANRVVAAKNPGLLDRLLANPNVGGSQIVMLEKEAILHKALNNCSESLLELERLNAGKSKDDRDYQNARRKAVIAELKELRTQNKEVCEKHKVNVQMPIVRVMFFSASCQIPLFGHKIGTLEDCIAEALKAMGGETKPEESHESEYGHSEPASSVH